HERDSRLALGAARDARQGWRADAHGHAGGSGAPLRSLQKCGRGCAAAHISGAGALIGTAGAAAHARGAAKLDGTANDVAARLVIALEGDRAALRGFLEQLVERAEAVVALVESRAAALQRLLDHRAPDLVLRAPLGEQGVDGGEHEVERFLLLVFVLLLAVL